MVSGRCQSAGNTPGRSARSLNSHALSPPIHSPILLNSRRFAQNLCVLCALCVSKKQSSRAVVSPSHGEAPTEPHPCHKRCTAPCRSTKTPTITHNADQHSVARQILRPPAFPVPQFRPVRPALNRAPATVRVSAHDSHAEVPLPEYPEPVNALLRLSPGWGGIL
jgi:hypothetical protein